MSSWPQIEDQRTLRRFAMNDAEFALLAERLAERIGGEQFTEQLFARALSYPWHTPPADGGFVVREGRVSVIDSIAEAGSLGDAPRVGLVAIGSNADPSTLSTKLAGLPDADDRALLGIHGTLLDVEIGHSPHLAVYGALPATVFRMIGAQTHATLLMVTAQQLTALSRTEFNYLLTRLPAEQFVGPAEQFFSGPLYAYVSRHGVVTDETGDPLPLHRPEQRELLDRMAKVAIGKSADARELVRRTIESYPWAVREARPRLSTLARPLDRGEWDLHPGN